MNALGYVALIFFVGIVLAGIAAAAVTEDKWKSWLSSKK